MTLISKIHFTIINFIIEVGYAPEVETLAELIDTDLDKTTAALYDLQEYHGVVLHPKQPKVWVIHPFSLAPTNFFVQAKQKSWWGNCAWCSLGIATLIKEDVKITTTIGAENKQVEINIREGEIVEQHFYIHFPTPMKNAWDNVIYTCSNMLVFENENQVEAWSQRHDIPKGDLQPIGKIWRFAQKWYGNHLNQNWKKWTSEEAKQMFKEFDLQNEIWDLESSKNRF